MNMSIFKGRGLSNTDLTAFKNVKRKSLLFHRLGHRNLFWVRIVYNFYTLFFLDRLRSKCDLKKDVIIYDCH